LYIFGPHQPLPQDIEETCSNYSEKSPPDRHQRHCFFRNLVNTYSLGTASYVTGVPFGGNVGTRDALVLEGFSYANPSTLERYYYVSGLGRVRENNAQRTSGGQTPYNQKGQNLDRNQEKAVNSSVIYANGNHGGCPQGSAITLH